MMEKEKLNETKKAEELLCVNYDTYYTKKEGSDLEYDWLRGPHNLARKDRLSEASYAFAFSFFAAQEFETEIIETLEECEEEGYGSMNTDMGPANVDIRIGNEGDGNLRVLVEVRIPAKDGGEFTCKENIYIDTTEDNWRRIAPRLIMECFFNSLMGLDFAEEITPEEMNNRKKAQEKCTDLPF